MESPQWNQFVSQFQTLQLVDDFSSRLRSCSLTLAMEILLFKKEMYTFTIYKWIFIDFPASYVNWKGFGLSFFF